MTTEYRGMQLNCASLRIGLISVYIWSVDNCFLYARLYEWPFLRFTDNRKRCFKWKNGLNFEVEMEYKAGSKCKNYISGPETKDGALGGYEV